jgi:DNA-binding CsgD family transcriptional regulator
MARLEDDRGGAHELVGSHMILGRDVTSDIVVFTDKRVSRRHASLTLRDGQWVVSDLASRNGTLVNERLVQEHPLVDGDRIRVGASVFVFLTAVDPHATEAGSVVRPAPAGPELSAREREVVALVAAGKTDRQIAEQLFISASTVRSHLDRIGEKTGLRRRSELTRLAMELGLVR